MKDKELMRNMEDDPYKIKELQNKILEIEFYFDSFCKENNIKYFLMGGSALGAIRHKGFIPWDDDLDVFMDYNNYEKLLNCIDKIDTEKFYFQIQDSYEQPYFFSKLRMNGTTFLDYYIKPNRKIHQGIYIDIMCLYNVPSLKILQKIQYYEAGLLKAKAVQVYGYHTNSLKKKIQLFIANILVNKFTKNIIYKDICKYSNKNVKYLGHFFGRAKFKNSVYKKEWFEKQRYVDFENIKLPVPCGVEDYLSTRYGPDYIKMPSEETKKQYQSHAVTWDINKDYREYKMEKNKKKYKIGYTTGVFDMFHIGHLNILKRAKEQCEYLIVGVTTDELCFKRKNKYPIINQNERADIVKAIKYTDKVLFQEDMDKVKPVIENNVDVVFVGSDWQGTPQWTEYEKQFKKVGCDVVYLPHTDGISSTLLREKINKE